MRAKRNKQTAKKAQSKTPKTEAQPVGRNRTGEAKQPARLEIGYG